MNELREILAKCVHEINMLPHFEVPLDEIVKMNNKVYGEMERQIREWARGKVTEMAYPTMLGANVWNECRTQMIKNIEG